MRRLEPEEGLQIEIAGQADVNALKVDAEQACVRDEAGGQSAAIRSEDDFDHVRSGVRAT